IIFFNSNIEKAPLWALIALLIPSYFFQTQSSFILFSSLSAVIFITALLKDSYTMAYIDTLTGIPARRALEESFLKLGSTYSVAMVDIDFFKKFNDTYEHNVGDEVLKLVAEQLGEVKGGGKAFRYGGEEFTILFANKKHDEILVYLEDVRESIAKRAFIIRSENRPNEKPDKKVKQKKQKKVNLTVSIGVAHAPIDGKTPTEIMKKADISLYKAKESGRNCTITS
ncbi:MAG TPA: GGDEF domain-containing protein, partial [Sulfurospirillum arcachonense]|nr:GGDEF domain-containing protein [Sulfurospirillum arcachonense]